MALRFSVAVDSEQSFEEYIDTLNRYAEIPMPAHTSASKYASFAVDVERVARERYREQRYDDAYLLFKRCLLMIDSRIWKHREELDQPTSEVSSKQLTSVFKSAIEHQEKVMSEHLPALHRQHMAEIAKNKEHRERILAVARESSKEDTVPPSRSEVLEEKSTMPPTADEQEYERRRQQKLNSRPVSLFGDDNTQRKDHAPTPFASSYPVPEAPASAGQARPSIASMDDDQRRRLATEREQTGVNALLSGLSGALSTGTAAAVPLGSNTTTAAPNVALALPKPLPEGVVPSQPQKPTPSPAPAAVKPAAARPDAPVLMPVRDVSAAITAARCALWRYPAGSVGARPRRGLVNLGNTCYINSTLQCLASSCIGTYFQDDAYFDSLAERYTGGGKVANTFCHTMRELSRALPRGPVSASNLKRWIAEIDPRYDNFAQQDAQEFLLALVRGVHQDLNAKRNARGSGKDIENRVRSDAEIARDYAAQHREIDMSPITERMCFQQKSTIYCHECKEAGRTFPVTDLDLVLEIPRARRRISVEDCLAEFVKPTSRTGELQYACPTCRKKTDAVAQTTLYSTPPMLTLTLKRFTNDAKVSTEVAFQRELDLAPYVSGPASASTCRYRLVGVVNHQGSLGGGHYTADVRCGDSWWYCSDEDVRPSTEPSFSRAYVLFYQRAGKAT